MRQGKEAACTKQTHPIVDGPARTTDCEVKNATHAEGYASTHIDIAWNLMLPAERKQRSNSSNN